MNNESERIICIGDHHTVTALRIAGIEGMVASGDTFSKILNGLRHDKQYAIILITRELAAGKDNLVRDLNREPGGPSVLEIPGIHSKGGPPESVMIYINQALGIAL